MATSLYDRPLYRDRNVTRNGIRNYDNYDNYDDDDYDAIRDAREKFNSNPEKYAPVVPIRTAPIAPARPILLRRPYPITERREIRRIYVIVEHGGGCTSRSVCDNIRLAIEDEFPDVRFSERYGRYDSFEVFINGRCLYSRYAQGGYPYEDEVVEAVYRAKRGKTFHQLERGSSSNMCSIL